MTKELPSVPKLCEVSPVPFSFHLADAHGEVFQYYMHTEAHQYPRGPYFAEKYVKMIYKVINF